MIHPNDGWRFVHSDRAIEFLNLKLIDNKTIFITMVIPRRYIKSPTPKKPRRPHTTGPKPDQLETLTHYTMTATPTPTPP